MNLGRNRFVHRLTALLILVAVFTAHSFAFSSHALAATGVPNIISYQGRLRNASGDLLGSASGTSYYFKFSIYDNSSVGSGTKLWPSGSPGITTSTVTSGIFTVKIGDTGNGYPDALDYNFQDNKDVYLQIEVSSDGTTFETLSPRQRIASAGFAINAGTVQGFTPSQTPSGSAIPVLNAGNLLLSGTNPQINATSTNALILQGGGGTGDIRFFSASNTLSSLGNLLLAGGLTATTGNSSLATTTIAQLTVSGSSALQSVSLTNASSTNLTASGFINAGTITVSGTSTLAGVVSSFLSNTGATVLGSTLSVTGLATLSTVSATSATTTNFFATNASTTNLTVASNLYLPTDSITAAYLASTAVSAGTYGSASEVATFTVDADGRLTNATSTPIALGASAITSGILGVARGGTNTSTLGSAGSIAYSDGTGYAFSAVGSTNQLLTSGATGAPTFQNIVSLLTAGSNISLSGTTNATIAVSATPSFTTLSVSGTSTLANVSSTNITASGFVNSATLNVSGAAALGSTLSVTGASTLATTTATGLTLSTNGLTLSSSTPVSTSNTLYNLGGSLYFNGSAVGGGSSIFTDGAGISYLTDTAEDFALGGSTVSGSPFGVDVSAGTIYGGLASAAGLSVVSRVTDSGSSIGHIFNTANTLSTSGAKIASFKNNGTEKASIDKDGVLRTSGTAYLPTVILGNGGTESGYVTSNNLDDLVLGVYSSGNPREQARITQGAGLIMKSSDAGSYVSVLSAGKMTFDATFPSTLGDTYFSKSADSGGNLSTFYDGTEVQRFSATTTGAIGTSLTVGSLASPSSTLHVVGTFQVTATSTLSGPTIIDDLTVGNANFETDAGQVSWVDMPVTASSSNGTVMSYSAQLDGSQAIVVYGTSDGSGGIANLGVGFGTSTPGAIIHAYASGTTVGMFDRGISDGTVISIRRDNAEQGTISVTTGTVSYNAFTGSHYALLDDPTSTVAFGEVVTLTGNNRRLHGNETDEILYGIERTGVENDPAVLGVYLGPQESSKPASVDNPILVMAVGNGEVWVVADQDETGVMAGDYLITSDLPGYAMRDPRTATTSYVFARAGESINWNEVTATASAGRKKAKISVFFESFARDNAAMAPRAIVRTSSTSGGVIGTLETFESLTVNGPLTIKGPVVLGKDSAGQAKIMTGDQRVEVTFAHVYATMPIINVTPVGEAALDANFRYAIVSQSKEKFVLGLANPAYRDLFFNWTAFATASDALLTISNGTTLILNDEVIAPVSPTSSESPSNSPEVVSPSTQDVATTTPSDLSTPEEGTPVPVTPPTEEIVPTSTESVATSDLGAAVDSGEHAIVHHQDVEMGDQEATSVEPATSSVLSSEESVSSEVAPTVEAQ